MVNRTKKFIYVHIPKCAGTSIIKMFRAEWDRAVPDHSTLDEIYNISPSARSYYTFTVIRDPWDRMASLYSYILRGSESARKYQHKYGVYSFEDFIQNLKVLRSTFEPKTTYMSACDYIGDNKLDKVINIQNLEEGMLDLADTLNLKLPRVLTENRSSFTDKFKSQYTQEMVEIVADVYSDDITKFNFKYNG